MYHIIIFIIYYIYICSQKSRKCALPDITNRLLPDDISCARGFLLRTMSKD